MSRTNAGRRHRISTMARTVVLTVGVVLAPVLAPPGVATPSQAAVRSCSSTTAVTYRPTLRIGDTGSCVRVLQRALVARGYSVGAWGADGVFGDATYLAVRRFQSDY